MATLFEEEVRDERAKKYMEELLPKLQGWNRLRCFQTTLEKRLSEVIQEASKVQLRGSAIWPSSRNIFRSFEECSLDQASVVFIGQDPYHQAQVADGLAFSCGKTGREQPSLKFILNEVARTVYGGTYSRKTDLVSWVQQGVMLINSALTVEQSKPDSHVELWKPWMIQFVSELSKAKDNLIFVFVGRRAQQYSAYVGGNHHKINVIHPAAAAHRGGVWDCEDVFNRINNILKEQGKKSIVW